MLMNLRMKIAMRQIQRQSSMKFKFGKKNNTVTEELERCVMCGKTTEIPISKPIEFREYYEVGCGQLCSVCYKKLRGEANPNNILTNDEIVLAVERSRKKK